MIIVYIGIKNIQQLFSGSPNILKESEQTCCLTGWIGLENAPVPYMTHLLYVCEYKQDLMGFQLVPNMHVLCLVGEDADLERLPEEFPSSVNILFLKSENPKAIHRELLEYFDTQCGISLFADSLLEILSFKGGIQSMIDHAYHTLGNPIFVFDASFNLIAANWDEAKNTKIGARLIENRGFSKEEFEMVNRTRNYKLVQKSKMPVMAYNTELGYEQLLCAIDTQKDLGHIVVSAVNRPLNPIDSQMLQVLKKCIDQQFKKDEFVRNARGFHYEYFLKDILDGKIVTGKSFPDRLNYASSEFSGNMYCLVIETARSSDILNTHYIRNLFESRFPNTKTLMYNGGIIVILSIPQNRFLSKEYLNNATEICRENDLYAGLSNCFQNIIEIYEYYKQALRAIEMGVCTANHPDLFLYEDYYMEHIKNIFAQKESPQTFCHPKMKLLLNHDQKHNSELAHTLYMYLVNERNIAATSTAMHMHRNSLVYRIKKINSLIGDYENYRERQYLVLSYEINVPPVQ
jgi:hypothetical protein